MNINTIIKFHKELKKKDRTLIELRKNLNISRTTVWNYINFLSFFNIIEKDTTGKITIIKLQPRYKRTKTENFIKKFKDM